MNHKKSENNETMPSKSGVESKKKRKKQEKKQSGFNPLLAIILLILFAFVYFLPQISSFIRDFQNNNTTSKTPTNSGTLSCYLVKNMTDIDYTVETEFSYENDQLKRTTTTTEYALAAATSDKQVLLDKESSCQRLAATLSNTTGMSANCRLEEDKQTIIQTIDYAQLDLSYITDHIAEFEGFYPEYELNEDIDTIQTSMEQAGYTCTDTQR